MSTVTEHHMCWYEIENVSEIPSPALLVFPGRIEENIRRMIQVAGDSSRLRPHVKTYKMEEVITMQIRRGIRKFKCATIAEAELAARSGAAKVLLAMQPVGAHIPRFFNLVKAFPHTKFSAIVDSTEIVKQLSAMAGEADTEVTLWVDIDNGMHRSGLAPGADAVGLYRMIRELTSLRAGGLHVYDGHIHDRNLDARREHCDRDFAPVQATADELVASGFPAPLIVAGGTPTFPIHARRENVDCSPGTPLLWDRGYADRYPDLDFLIAAVLLARVVSKPASGLLCLDLGYKAVASEMPHPRVHLFGIDEHEVLNHSEEHLVLETKAAARYHVGDVVFGIPVHICPTVDRYETVYVVDDRKVTGEWEVTAGKRKITI